MIQIAITKPVYNYLKGQKFKKKFSSMDKVIKYLAIENKALRNKLKEAELQSRPSDISSMGPII